MLIQGGDCEVLRDEVTLLAHKATLAGVEVVHEVYEDAVHVFQLYPFLEQSRKAFRSCRKFVFDTLPAIKAKQRAAAHAQAQAQAQDGGRLARYPSNVSFLSVQSERENADGLTQLQRGAAISPSGPGPVSPPLTPPRVVSPLPSSSPVAVRHPTSSVLESSISQLSAAETSGSNSDSEDSGSNLGAMVESVLEREIKGVMSDGEDDEVLGAPDLNGGIGRDRRGRSGSMIVVDAHGVEQPAGECGGYWKRR